MEKKIPKKNYIIFALIIVITILTVFYARTWYNTTKEYNSQNSPMLTVIGQIKADELDDYILENPKFILYASSGQNREIKEFENEFKNLVINQNLSPDMLYINTDQVNKNEFVNKLKGYAVKTIKDRINLNENVSMFIFENGKIVNIILNANNLNGKQLETLLEKHGMIEND